MAHPPTRAAATASTSPAGATSPPAPLHRVTVRHKHGREGLYASEGGVERSLFVLVGADRGTDLGCVVESRRLMRGEDSPRYRVHGPASASDVRRYYGELVAEEAKAAKVVQHRAVANNVAITVQSAEYAFDKHKIIINFTSDDERPDFRPLLNDAYRALLCRIWMNNVGFSKDKQQQQHGAAQQKELAAPSSAHPPTQATPARHKPRQLRGGGARGSGGGGGGSLASAAAAGRGSGGRRQANHGQSARQQQQQLQQLQLLLQSPSPAPSPP